MSKLVGLEMADGSGPFDVDPDAVESIQPSSERPKEWSFITLRDGHSATVKGTVDQVAEKLGRAP